MPSRLLLLAPQAPSGLGSPTFWMPASPHRDVSGGRAGLVTGDNRQAMLPRGCHTAEARRGEAPTAKRLPLGSQSAQAATTPHRGRAAPPAPPAPLHPTTPPPGAFPGLGKGTAVPRTPAPRNEQAQHPLQKLICQKIPSLATKKKQTCPRGVGMGRLRGDTSASPRGLGGSRVAAAAAASPHQRSPRGGERKGFYRARGLLLTKVEAVIGRVGPPPLLRAVAGHGAEAAARRPPPPPPRRQQPRQPRRRAHDGGGHPPPSFPFLGPPGLRRSAPRRAAPRRPPAPPAPRRQTSHGGGGCCRPPGAAPCPLLPHQRGGRAAAYAPGRGCRLREGTAVSPERPKMAALALKRRVRGGGFFPEGVAAAGPRRCPVCPAGPREVAAPPC